MFPAVDVVEALAGALIGFEAALRLEQAVHGLDEWPETKLQLALAEALAPVHDVAREVHYPSATGRKRSARARCDFVLRAPDRELWLELKVARQHTTGGRADPRYGEQWRRHLVADLKKLAGDPRIRWAAVALIAFTADEARLMRDLDDFERLLVDRDVLAGFRQVRTLPIVERIGHRVCGVAVWPAG
jgi:hypothetical protein